MKRNHTFYPASRLWARGENWEIFFGSKMYNLRKISLRFPMTSRSENYTRKFFTIYFFAVVSFFGAHTPHTVDEEKQTKNISDFSRVAWKYIEKILFYKIYIRRQEEEKSKISFWKRVCNFYKKKFSHSLTSLSLSWDFTDDFNDVIKLSLSKFSQSHTLLSLIFWVSLTLSILSIKKLWMNFFLWFNLEEKRATTCDYFFIVGVRPYRFHKKKRRAVLCT